MKTKEMSIPAVMIRHHRRAGKPGTHIWEYDESILKLKSISSININKREICMENGGIYEDVEPDDLKKIIGYFDDLLDRYKEDNMEFHREDIVVVTVEHPDGSETVTKGNMGIITEKKTTELGIDYTVHTWSSDYVYGADQLRLATKEEKDAKLIDLMMKLKF